MTDLRVLVVDDEPLACEMVAELVRADPDVASVICCADATEAAQALAHDRPDIAFLDVEMPETNGIAVAAGLPDDGPVTVFITAFSQYAPQAFDVRAIDYVLKPFSDERFREALDRAKRRVRDRRRLERADRTGVTAADSPPAPPARLERLTLGTRDRIGRGPHRRRDLDRGPGLLRLRPLRPRTSPRPGHADVARRPARSGALPARPSRGHRQSRRRHRHRRTAGHASEGDGRHLHSRQPEPPPEGAGRAHAGTPHALIPCRVASASSRSAPRPSRSDAGMLWYHHRQPPDAAMAACRSGTP